MSIRLNIFQVWVCEEGRITSSDIAALVKRGTGTEMGAEWIWRTEHSEHSYPGSLDALSSPPRKKNVGGEAAFINVQELRKEIGRLTRRSEFPAILVSFVPFLNDNCKLDFI